MSKTVLIIDDSEAIRMSVKFVLSKEGYETLVTHQELIIPAFRPIIQKQ